MKQTNNAIKFLLAQYRAIYKHALIKGVLTTSVLSLGLATGIANAALTIPTPDENDLTATELQKDLDGNYTVYGHYKVEGKKYQDLQITTSVTGFNGTINIDSGSYTRPDNSSSFLEHNHIANANLTGKGILKINTGHKVQTQDSGEGTDGRDDGGLSIFASGTGSTTVNLKEITIGPKGGNLHIANMGSASDNSTIVTADIINIHSGNTKAERSTLQFGADTEHKDTFSGSGDIQLGSLAGSTDTTSGTLIHLKGDQARLVANGNTSGDANIQAEKIVMDAGGFYAKVLSDGQSVHLKSRQVEMNGGEFLVNADASGDFIIDLTHYDKTETEQAKAGQFNVNKGVFNVNSALTLQGGVLDFSKDAQLVVAHDKTDSGDVAHIKVKSTDPEGSGATSIPQAQKAENTAVLQAYSDTLKGFLNGGVKGNFADDNNNLASEKGAIELSDYGILALKDTNDSVDIATQFKYASGTVSTASSGRIHVSGTGIISGDKITISKALDVSGAGSKTAVDLSSTNKLYISTNTLTLGASNSASPTQGKFNFAEAITKNVNFVSKEASLTLGSNVTLQSINRSIGIDGEELATSSTGEIQGAVTLVSGAALTVDGGQYIANDNITLSSGTVSVVSSVKESSKTGSDAVLSSLTIKDLAIDASKNNKLEASGSNTILNIGKITAFGTISSSTSKFTASSGGVINVQADDVQKALDAAAGKENLASYKGISFTANKGGLVNIDGSLTLNYTETATNNQAVNAVLNAAQNDETSSKGIIKATGIHVVSENTDTFSMLANGIYSANEFSLNAQKADDSYLENVDITKGEYHIGSSLSSYNNTLNFTGKDTKVIFGQIKDIKDNQGNIIYSIGNANGDIFVQNLKISDTANIDIQSGLWSAENIEVSGGTFTLGSASEKYTAQDKLIEASLNGQKLTINTGSFEITKQGIANFNELHASSASALDISGFMKVNGTEITSDNTEGKDVAVKLGTNSITVNNGGELVFDTLAVHNSIFEKIENDAVVFKTGIQDDAINLGNNGKVKLEFDKSVSFSQAQLTSLKSKLFNNDTNGKINGILHIGSAGIDGISEHIKDDGKGNPTIAWDKLQGVADIEQNADVTNDKLINAKVTGVNSGFKSQVGSLETTTSQASIVGNSSLNNAQGNNGLYASTTDGKVANISIENASSLGLNNGGAIGTVYLDANSSLVTGGTGTTIIASISGNSGDFFANAENTIVSGTVSVRSLDVHQGKALAVSGKTITNSLDINGQANFTDALHVKGDALIEGNTQVSTIATFEQGLELANNASLKAKEIKLGQQQLITVGRVAGSEGELTWEDSSGFLQAERLDLNGGTIIADPSYGNKASIVALNELGSTKAEKNTAGSLEGRLIAAQNSIIALGVGSENVEQHLNEAFLNKFIDSKGSLNGEELGAVAYVAKGLTVQNGSQIIVDSQLTTSSFHKDVLNTKQTGHDIYLAENSALVIDEKALSKDKAAIYFDKDGATIYGDGGKVLLSGTLFTQGKDHNIFAAKTGDVKAVTDGTKKLRFESLNGLFYQDFANNDTIGSINLKLNKEKVEYTYNNATDSVKETLLAYGTANNDWQNQDQSEKLTNGLAKGLTYDKTTGQITDKAGNIYNTNDYVIITDNEGNGTVYNEIANDFLTVAYIDNLDGSIADKAANIGIYGGVAQSALAVGSATNDAISSRMGVGGQSNLTFANNGQGAGLWVSPLYKNYESEGFKAQNLKYGVDMDMYGLALGGDYTMANGLRMGLMFNVGSGDADGQQAAQGVKNDFDFFGFGLYGGYEMNNFSIMADVSYSVADNDVKTSSSIDKISASLDSKALSLGVTGQYKLALNGLNVVPHAGLRFTRIDMDDYSIKGEKYGHIADVDSEDLNIFSIPVGVSISKDIVAGTWTVKPSFDLTLTGNFGDDVAKSKVDWTGVDNLFTDVKGEVIDSFTYGASLGIAAQSGNFSFGLGTNYTGSSNTNEFGLNANARFVF